MVSGFCHFTKSWLNHSLNQSISQFSCSRVSVLRSSHWPKISYFAAYQVFCDSKGTGRPPKTWLVWSNREDLGGPGMMRAQPEAWGGPNWAETVETSRQAGTSSGASIFNFFFEQLRLLCALWKTNPDDNLCVFHFWFSSPLSCLNQLIIKFFLWVNKA